MDDYAIIIIEGGTLAGSWYIAKNMVQFLTSDLGNTGSNNITLYRTLGSGNTSRERITISSLGQAQYNPVNGTPSYISGYTVSSYSLAAQIYRYDPLYMPLLILLLGLLVIVKVVRHD